VRLSICFGLSVVLLAPVLHAQLQQPYADPSGTVAGITVTIPALNPGVQATVDAFASCAPGAASLLKPGIDKTSTVSGDLSLLLATPLPAGSPICVTETFAVVTAALPAPALPAAITPTLMVVMVPQPAPVVLAAPAIEAVKPAAQFIVVDPVKPGAGKTATLDVFSTCSVPPAAGTSLLAPKQVTTVDDAALPLTLKLARAAAANDTLCAVQTITTPAVAAVAASSTTTPSTLVTVAAPAAPTGPKLTLTSPTTLAVTDPGVPDGTTISLYTLTSPYACSTAAPAKPLALAPASATKLTSGAVTLTLPAALTSPTVFCAADSAAKPNLSPAYLFLTNIQPVFKKLPLVGATSLLVQATPSDSTSGTGAGWINNVQILQLINPTDPCDLSHGTPAALAGSSTSTSVATDTSGSVAFTLAAPLAEGATVCALEAVAPGNGVVRLTPLDTTVALASIDQPVGTATDWGLVRAYFTGGILLANDSSNFSSAYEFLDLTVDKTWMMPHATGTFGHKLGFSTYFDARLTAIPIASNPANTTASTPTTLAAAPSTSSFLSSQKTARIAVGAYLPFSLKHWKWNGNTNALFLAPMSKVGFDTITGSSQQNVILPSGASGTENYAQVYKFWTYGARIGHMQMSKASNVAPQTYSYLDIGIGPYSNLESLECNRTQYTLGSPGSTPPVVAAPLPGNYTATTYTTNATTLPNGDCALAYPTYYQNSATPATFQYLPYETLKRIYRLDLEGLLQIPGTAFYVGFNANIGQKAAGAGRFDPAFNAPDDLRFFIGTKFDISTVITKLLPNIGN
jgi:hypothetical protein